MADITTYLEQIENAIYGEEVRQSIHDAIKQCYEDGSAGAVDYDIAVLHPIPGYLKSMYETGKSNLLAVQGTNTSSIGFICDTHYITDESNSNYSKLRTGVFEAFNTLAMLSTEIPLNLTVLGGDICGSCGSADYGLLALMEANKAMSKVQGHKVILVGDHDVDFASGSGSEVDLTMDDIYNVSLKQYYFNDATYVTDGYYAYYDDSFAKIRYIFLQCYSNAYNSDTGTWLSTALAGVPDGYGVIVFNHFGIYGHSNAEATIYTGTKAYLDLVAASGVNFIAWICGHAHCDWGLEYNGMLVICCENAGLWNGRLSQKSDTTVGTKTLGSDTESAFSILTVDQSEKTITVTRFGNGEDHVYSYDTNSTGEVDSSGDGGDTGDTEDTEDSGETTNYTNQIPISTDADGNIYNDVGYKYGCHLSVSSGVISETSSSSYCSGFIPCTPDNVVRLKDVYPPIDDISTASLYTLMLCDSDKAGTIRLNFSGAWADTTGQYFNDMSYDATNNIYEFKINGSDSHISSTAYIRISRTLEDLGEAIVTIDEEIS